MTYKWKNENKITQTHRNSTDIALHASSVSTVSPQGLEPTVLSPKLVKRTAVSANYLQIPLHHRLAYPNTPANGQPVLVV